MITDSGDHNSVRLATINVKITIVDTIYCGKGCFDRDHKKIYVGMSAIKASVKIKSRCMSIRTLNAPMVVHELFRWTSPSYD